MDTDECEWQTNPYNSSIDPTRNTLEAEAIALKEAIAEIRRLGYEKITGLEAPRDINVFARHFVSWLAKNFNINFSLSREKPIMRLTN